MGRRHLAVPNVDHDANRGRGLPDADRRRCRAAGVIERRDLTEGPEGHACAAAILVGTGSAAGRIAQHSLDLHQALSRCLG